MYKIAKYNLNGPSHLLRGTYSVLFLNGLHSVPFYSHIVTVKTYKCAFVFSPDSNYDSAAIKNTFIYQENVLI